MYLTSEFKPLSSIEPFLGNFCSPHFLITIDGDNNNVNSKFSWKIGCRPIISTFTYDWDWLNKEDLPDLAFVGSSRQFSIINLYVRPTLTMKCDFVIPDDTDDYLFVDDFDNSPPESDSDEAEMGETPQELDFGDEIDINPEDVPDFDDYETITTQIDTKFACIGKGIQNSSQKISSRDPYRFLGLLILFDSDKEKIIDVRTDCDGSASWYKHPYQVIFYPTGLPQLPLLKVAVCLWETDLSKMTC